MGCEGSLEQRQFLLKRHFYNIACKPRTCSQQSGRADANDLDAVVGDTADHGADSSRSDIKAGNVAPFCDGWFVNFPRQVRKKRWTVMEHSLFIGMMHLLGDGLDHTREMRQFGTDGKYEKPVDEIWRGSDGEVFYSTLKGLNIVRDSSITCSCCKSSEMSRSQSFSMAEEIMRLSYQAKRYSLAICKARRDVSAEIGAVRVKGRN
jgi:hypothetical protein